MVLPGNKEMATRYQETYKCELLQIEVTLQEIEGLVSERRPSRAGSQTVQNTCRTKSDMIEERQNSFNASSVIAKFKNVLPVQEFSPFGDEPSTSDQQALINQVAELYEHNQRNQRSC